MPKATLQCCICNKQFDRYIYDEKPRHFCSKACLAIGNIGENNPNYGNKWTEEQRKQAGEEKRKFFAENPDKAHACGKTNRGKKFSEDRIQKMHAHRTRESYQHYPNDETRRIIGQKSSAKWTDEYKQRNRRIREEKGVWIPLELKSDWEVYQKEANWISRMFDIIDDPRQILLEYGVFNAKTNTKGVVRDHIYGRKSGFYNGVFPEIMRHPANCQILLHSENVAKKKERYVDDDGHTLDELFEAIRRYNKEWCEHEIVLQRIKEYENGKRYERK